MSLSVNAYFGTARNIPTFWSSTKIYEIKYALDGNAVESFEKLGYVYPWSRGHFTQIDPLNGRVRVDVDIAEDDLIFGFYFYEELDLIYTALDVNPFTNPAIRNGGG